MADREAARNRKQRNRFSLIDFLMFPPCRPNFLTSKSKMAKGWKRHHRPASFFFLSPAAGGIVSIFSAQSGIGHGKRAPLSISLSPEPWLRPLIRVSSDACFLGRSCLPIPR